MQFVKLVFYSMILCAIIIAPMQAALLNIDKPRLELADPFAVFRYQSQELGTHQRHQHLYLQEPLILLDEHEQVHVSHFLKFEQDLLLRMNALSYQLVRNADDQIKMTVEEMYHLREAGWTIRGFSGLEGRRNTYPDMSGIICFHPQDSLIVVVYRGTAGNKDGWDTNFDATKINPAKIQKELCRDMFDEALELIKESESPRKLKPIKKIIRAAQDDEPGLNSAKATYAKVVKELDELNIDPDLTDDILEAFQQKLDFMTAIDEVGFEIEGEVHRGFLKKYLSTKRELLTAIKEFYNQLDKDGKSKLKIVFTGHSQAGATGSLALADICSNHGHEIFGKDFDNQTDYRFYGYFLSAARVGNKEFRKWMHRNVGRRFIVRQNVDGDPTPVSAGDERMHGVVNQIPVVGEVLSKRFTLYDDTGYLLLDDGHKTWKRARELYEEEGFDMSRFEEIEDLVRYVASWVIPEEEKIPKYLVPKTSSTSFIWSPIKWVRNRIQTAQTVNLLRRSLMGDQDAVKELEEFSEVVIARYAHLHYGHYLASTGASFHPEVVGRDLDGMANRGREHEIKRKGKKELEP